VASGNRAIIAARLSKLGRDRREGIGLDTQDARSREFAEREGYEVIATVADTKSGNVAPFDRKHLKPWVTDPEHMACYDVIIAYKNDRLSRGAWADEVRIRLWAEENHKRLIIVDGPQWPPRHDGDKWSWEAQADQARKEWEAIRERNMRAQAGIRANGGVVNRVPWGWQIVGEKYAKQIVPTDACREYVPQMFARCLGGESLRSIARWLDSEGVPTTYGGKWSEVTVRKLIMNMTYAGRHQGTVWDSEGRKRTETILRCEPIVDMATWNAAQKALQTRPKRGPVAKTNRPLLAKLLCARCDDSPMYRINISGSLYYRCYGRGAQRRGCGNMVRLDALDQMVNVRMLHWHTDQHTTLHVVPGKNWDAEIADAIQAIRELDPLASDYDDKLAKLRAELADLRQREAIPETIDRIPTGQTIGQHYVSLGHDERRDYLAANHDIRAEKLPDWRKVRVIIDGRSSDRTTLLGMDYWLDADGRPVQRPVQL
jgi:DNA invertase Pin-like site-specific DNA recombinase